MSIASRIQEIETHIGDVYDTIDYSYDTTGVNKNIINIPKYLKKGYIDIINNGTDNLYSNFPKVSGIGSNLSLTPTYEAPMKLNEIQGSTLQDGTPTPDTPVEIQSVTGLQNITISNADNTDSNTYEVNLGKNLFDINGTFTGNLIKYNNGFQLIKNSTNRTINYLSSSPIPKGTYTLSYEIVSSTLSDVNKLLIQFFNADNTNILTKALSSTGSLNCILTEDVTKIYFYISNSEETDTQITFDNIQLEKGTQSTSFSPYFTPIELNKIGTYEDSIKKSTGKNLVYGIEQGNFNYLTGALVENANKVRTKKIPVKPNTTYTISSKLALGESTTYYYEQDGTTGIAGSLLISTTTVKSISFTTPNNAYYVMISLGYSTVPYNASDDNNIMLNEGTVIPYEPYGKVWYITENIGKVVLDGSENWSMNNMSASGNTYKQFYIPYTLAKTGSGLSNHFTYNIGDIAKGNHFYINGSQTLMVFPHVSVNGSDITSLADFKTWLGTHNTTVLYQLETPIYEVITNTELINQLETLYNAKSKNGTTNITITSQDLAMILNVGVLKGDA